MGLYEINKDYVNVMTNADAESYLFLHSHDGASDSCPSRSHTADGSNAAGPHQPAGPPHGEDRSSLSFFEDARSTGFYLILHRCSVQAQQMTMQAMNLSQQQTQEQQKKQGKKKTEEEEKYQRRRSERRSRGRSRSPSPRAPSPKSDRHKMHKKPSSYRKSDSEVLLCMMN